MLSGCLGVSHSQGQEPESACVREGQRGIHRQCVHSSMTASVIILSPCQSIITFISLARAAPLPACLCNGASKRFGPREASMRLGLQPRSVNRAVLDLSHSTRRRCRLFHFPFVCTESMNICVRSELFRGSEREGERGRKRGHLPPNVSDGALAGSAPVGRLAQGWGELDLEVCGSANAVRHVRSLPPTPVRARAHTHTHTHTHEHPPAGALASVLMASSATAPCGKVFAHTSTGVAVSVSSLCPSVPSVAACVDEGSG